jgi:uncharacterized membrane protein
MFAFRWIHFVAGITWIGLLYYFNLVHANSMKVIEASARPQVVTHLLPRALFWFRHGAWATVLAGFIIIYLKYWRNGDFMASDGAKTILIGGLLGVLMMLNVWGIIWRNQKKVIAATVAGTAPDPSWARQALLASRANVTMSWPMLAFMAGASHYPQDWAGIAVWTVVLGGLALLMVLWVQKGWIFAPKAA